MKVSVSLGGTINIGNYNTARVDVSVEGDPGESYKEVFERAQELYFDAAYHHVKAMVGDENSVEALISHLVSKLKSEPRY